MDVRNAAELFQKVTFRTWKKTFRRPVMLTFSFVQPMFWMLFFGFLMHRYPLSELPPNTSYISFLLPGISAMTVLFGSSQAGISLIRDLQIGFLQRMLITPAPTSILFAGKITADSIRLLAQALVVMLLGVALGARVSATTAEFLMGFVSLFFFSMALGSLSSIIALRSRRQETLATFVHLVNMPIFFTSTALVPHRNMPDWLAFISHWNPLTLAVEDLRNALLFHDGSRGSGAPWLALFAVLLMFLAIREMKRGMLINTWEVR